MTEYPKIHSVWKRDDKGRIIEGDFARPEFSYLCNAGWYALEKVDGMNIRVLWDGEHVKFKGKTDAAHLPATLFARLGELFHDPALFRAQFGDCTEVCLYGEGYGARIQKGENYKPDGQDFVLFDVRVGGWWLERVAVVDVAMALGCDSVPIGPCAGLVDLCSAVRAGVRSRWGDFEAEGYVMHPAVALRCRNGERIIAKIKTRDYARDSLARENGGQW